MQWVSSHFGVELVLNCFGFMPGPLLTNVLVTHLPHQIQANTHSATSFRHLQIQTETRAKQTMTSMFAFTVLAPTKELFEFFQWLKTVASVAAARSGSADMTAAATAGVAMAVQTVIVAEKEVSA